MRRLVLSPAFASFAVLWLVPAAAADIEFPDKNLEAAVRRYVFAKRDTDKPLTTDDVAGISTIHADGKGIKDLKGLEHCVSLAELRLARNEIADIAPLVDLKKLQSLDLSRNKISDIKPLEKLEGIQLLDLSHNQVEHLAPLAGIKAMRSLYLTGNKVADLGPLKGLEHLWTVYAGGNKIASIEPLAGLTGITDLQLDDNQIADLAPLAGLGRLRLLFLRNNKIADIAPLAAALKADAAGEKRMAPFLELYIAGNPLSDASKKSLEELKSLGVRVKSESAAKPPESSSKAPAGARRPSARGGYMREIPKLWARLLEIDPAAGTATFLPEGREQSATLPLNPDAQVHARGSWGALSDLAPGERVWVWVDFARDKKWTGIRVLADEISAHALHGSGGTVKAVDAAGGRITVAPPRGDAFDLRATSRTRLERGERAGGPEILEEGDPIFYQQAWDGGGYEAVLVLDGAALERLRARSLVRAEERWLAEGFRGDVTWMHPPQGEARVQLHAPAMRWSRALGAGDTVRLRVEGAEEIAGVVVASQPLYEKTEVHLVVEGVEQARFALGKPIVLVMDRPELPDGDLPADLGRRPDRGARLDWLLSTIYCTCPNAGDVCAGHFYTLAACNSHRCGMPGATLKSAGEMIDAELADAEILKRLQKERGPLLLRQHILP